MGAESKRERELREQLEAAQAITHIGSWEWVVGEKDVSWSTELYRIYGLEPHSVQINLEGFLGRLRPDQRERIQREIERSLQRPGRFAYREIIVRPDGSERIVDTIGDAIAGPRGEVVKLVGTCRDITDETARNQRLQFYSDIFEHAEIALVACKLDPQSSLRIVACNVAFEQICAVSGDVLDTKLADLLPAGATTLFEAAQRIAAGERVVRPAPFRRTGTSRSVILAATLFPISAGMIGMAIEDVTERIYTDGVHANERRALTALAAGKPLEEILTSTVRAIEEVATGTLASIVLLEDDGVTIRDVIGPSLPDIYIKALEGLEIGPTAGSFGAAMFRRETVIVEDIEHDPIWADHRQLALEHGLRSCWSHPIVGSDGRVLGAFALYGAEVRRPGERGLEAMKRTAHITAIVMERRILDDELRALAGRIERTREDERTRIAREIHDQLGQTITALRLDVGWLKRRLDDAAIRNKLDEMAQTTDDVLVTVRRIAADLRPGVLDELGLPAAIAWQAKEFEQRSGVRTTVDCEVGNVPFDREVVTDVFRMLQEALTNVARHANASNVEITLTLDRDHLQLEISDDGIGLPEIAPRNSSLGLLGMRERARRLGGDCLIKRRSPRGTTVAIIVPVRMPTEQFLDRVD